MPGMAPFAALRVTAVPPHIHLYIHSPASGVSQTRRATGAPSRHSRPRRRMVMHARPTTRRRTLAAGFLVLAGTAAAAGLAIGSDHQDSPEVELNPKMDMTDVYAFPGAAAGRIVLVMNTRAFLTPGATAA